MDVGLALPQYEWSVPDVAPLPWATVASWAREAERLGLASLWLADHLFLDTSKYGGPAEPAFGYDPITGLAALARVTTRAQLGVLVACVPLRPPKVLAKQLVTVDQLSGGRVVAGLGAGWYEPELHAAGIDFAAAGVRITALEQAAVEVRAAFGGGDGAWPAPVRAGGPPVWIGGKGDRLLKVAGRVADGWNTVWTWTPAAYAERSRHLDEACEAAGRDPGAVTRSVGLYALVGESEADVVHRFERLVACSPPGVLDGVTLAQWREGHLVGTVEQVREQLGAWEAVGVTHLVAGLGAVPFAVTHPDDLVALAAAVA